MKNKLLVSLIFLFSVFGNAQNSDYYYYKGQKVNLERDNTLLNIIADENIQKSSITALNLKDFELETDNSNAKTQKIAKLEFQKIPTDLEFLQKVNSLKDNPNINNVSFYYKRTNTSSIGTSNYFYIKLKSSDDLRILQKIASQKNVQIVKQVPNMPLWYILSLKKNTIGNSLEISNYFYETGFFDDVDPAFMFNFRKNYCANDTDFGSLWGLYNSTNPAIDINACQAWDISQGNGVKVAVVDQGIDKTHDDLSGNISSLSYDTQIAASPSVFINGNVHGTHVAGTIGAIKDNNLQVVGVAPLSKIMSVSHSLLVTPNVSAELASGISWAYQNGADVINNSWGDQGGQLYNQLHSAILESAITDAMTLGRNNKGTLVVFAAGNYGHFSPVMDYPGNFNDNIMSVGSITSEGARSVFSGYGTKLDVVAPGSGILSTTPNNEIDTLDGTSMASPHVAGLCALILSVKPCLTGQQVRDIIEKTSQKVGGYSYSIVSGRLNGTWNNQMGYGLIDAYKAVQTAQANITIVTAEYDNFCTNAEVYMGIVALGANAGHYLNFYNFHSSIPGQDNLIRLEPNGYTPDGTPRYFIVAPKTLLGENIWYTMSYYDLCGQQIIKAAEFPLTPYECDDYDVSKTISSNTFTIYPNPSSSTINVALVDKNNAPLKKSIITGKLYDFNNNVKRSLSIKNNTAQIDVTGLKKGIYVLKVDIDGKIESHRVIIE